MDKLDAFDKGLRGGLCEGVTKDAAGNLSLGCKLCDLIKLANRLIQFMSAFAFGIAVMFFLYASYLMMWGGVSGESLALGDARLTSDK